MAQVTPADQPAVFSTVGLPARQRIELWEDHNADALIGLRCRTLAATVLEATEINLQLGRVQLARVHGTSHVVERDAELIRQRPTDSVSMFFGLTGEAFFYHDDGVRALQPGQLLICDADRPFMRGFSHGLEELVLKVPREAFSDLTGLDDVTQPIVVGFGSGSDPFAHALARHIGRAARAENPQPADEELVLDLVGSLVGTKREPMASTYRVAVTNFIDRHLADHTLSASQVAHAVGISTRHLSRVLAEADTSFPKHVMRRRLAAAHALLHDPALAATTIAEIARRCGFTSSAHFSHAFSLHYGQRATEVRHRAIVAHSMSPS
nr:AraC family transcriptional regulator [Rhodococcus wratislaviensis]GLK40455.1 transcriptional regulator [Rhodococcus wratislaviensis]